MAEIPKESFKIVEALKANPRREGGGKAHLAKDKMAEDLAASLVMARISSQSGKERCDINRRINGRSTDSIYSGDNLQAS